MKRWLPFVILLASGLAPAKAQETAIDPPVAALISDIETGNLEAASGRVKGIFLMQEPVMLVQSPDAFVALVGNCSSTIEESRLLGGNPIYRMSWSCPDGRYEAWFGTDPDGEVVEVWDVADEAMIAIRAARRPTVPPMPRSINRGNR